MPKGRRSAMQPLPRSSYTGSATLAGQCGDLVESGVGGEALRAKIAGVNAQQQAGPFTDGGAIIADMGAIGGPDLA